MGASGAIPRTLVTDQTGTFRFEDVPAGDGFLDVHHPRYRPDMMVVSRVLPDDVYVCPVRLLRGLSLAGTVIAGSQGAGADVAITVNLHDRYLNLPAGQVTASSSGAFEFDAVRAGGQYLVTASAPGFGSASEVVHVPTEGPAPFVTLSLDDAWVLTGDVINSVGTPLPGVRVSVEPTAYSNADPLVVFTDQLGRFTVENLGDHAYRVIAFQPGYAVEAVAPVTRDDYSESGLQITLALGNVVIGEVVDIAGDPVVAAWVRLQSRDASGRPLGPQLYAYSGADGFFRFDHVHPGTVSLMILASGHAQALDRFLLSSEGAPEERMIVLKPE